jgi:aspartyl protease family protein
MKKTYIVLILSALLIFTSGCTCSSRRKIDHKKQSLNKENKTIRTRGKKTTVKMEKVNGVFQIPVEVNGVNMFFIFDTGASFISISQTEANFLYKQGKLEENDIKGTAKFSDANGDISEGTIINLKTIKIGNRVLYNIEASVVHNLNAPLLFGQSALEKFGKISIDNNREEIIFE